jgi:hypothetical protein
MKTDVVFRSLYLPHVEDLAFWQAVSCKKHPKYTAVTAKRPPSSNCKRCWQIWRRKEVT